MDISLLVEELPSPRLQFGSATQQIDPKLGLENAGPFDLRFGSGRKDVVDVGIVGPADLIADALAWISRMKGSIQYGEEPNLLHRSFPSFQDVFHKTIEVRPVNQIALENEAIEKMVSKMNSPQRYSAFQEIVDTYSDAMSRLGKRDTNRPDILLVLIPDSINLNARTVDRQLSSEQRKVTRQVAKHSEAVQLDLFDMQEEVSQTASDLLRRDLRHALKAKALFNRLPIQLVTSRLIKDSSYNQNSATRAWNFGVGLYYKSGGVPWRLPSNGPETCFVGISFHHFRTTQQHIVHSSLAQAFSSEGEGFAIRGEGIPVEPHQRRMTNLSENQARNLGLRVIGEYRTRTGHSPLRMVIHKSSQFDDAETRGFRCAFKEIPVVNMVTLIPSAFRLLRFGSYPVSAGTLCTVNRNRTFLYTTGYIPEIGTYPGPHIPQPFEIRTFGDYSPEEACVDIYGLTRMNWNSADVRGKWPVTLSFARRVGGILDECGDRVPEESSLRYFM